MEEDRTYLPFGRRGGKARAPRLSPAERDHSLEALPGRLPALLLLGALDSARLRDELEICRLLRKGEGERPRVEEAPRTGRQGWVPLPFVLV